MQVKTGQASEDRAVPCAQIKDKSRKGVPELGPIFLLKDYVCL